MSAALDKFEIVLLVEFYEILRLSAEHYFVSFLQNEI